MLERSRINDLLTWTLLFANDFRRLRMGNPNKQEFPPLLPLGFHPMSIADLRVLAVDAFKSSKRRKPLMDGLEQVIAKLITDGIQADIWVDGSFLTKKTDPDDSDILVVMEGDFLDKANKTQQDAVDWLNSDLYPSHKCHSHLHFMRPASHAEHSNSVWYGAYWLRQFGFTRKEEPKGIAVIKIP
jgi:hypothetical protein